MNDAYRVPSVDEMSVLLASQGLPTADLTPALLENFIAGYDQDILMVVGGLEFRGAFGLLRSVVTAKEFRGRGLAATMVNRLEEIARRRGIEVMYLITIDSEGYFTRLGYSVIPRDEVPNAIQGTAQFSDLCPATAAVMMKKL